MGSRAGSRPVVELDVASGHPDIQSNAEPATTESRGGEMEKKLSIIVVSNNAKQP
jgi:hypothetical protein